MNIIYKKPLNVFNTFTGGGEKRMRKLVLLIFFFALTAYAFNISVYAEDVPDSKEQPAVTASDDKSLAKDATNEDEEIEDIDIEMEATFVKDPIRKYNRAIFTFNDKLYFYVMKPAYKGYNKAVPEKARLSVRKFFLNIRTPVRFFNCLFPGNYILKGQNIRVLSGRFLYHWL